MVLLVENRTSGTDDEATSIFLCGDRNEISPYSGSPSLSSTLSEQVRARSSGSLACHRAHRLPAKRRETWFREERKERLEQIALPAHHDAAQPCCQPGPACQLDAAGLSYGWTRVRFGFARSFRLRSNAPSFIERN